MTKLEKDLVARIDRLEREVRELQARPVFVPQPYPVITPAQPLVPWGGTPAPMSWPSITCGTTGGASSLLT